MLVSLCVYMCVYIYVSKVAADLRRSKLRCAASFAYKCLGATNYLQQLSGPEGRADSSKLFHTHIYMFRYTHIHMYIHILVNSLVLQSHLYGGVCR